MKNIILGAIIFCSVIHLKAQDSLRFQNNLEKISSIQFCGSSPDYVKKMNDAYSSYRSGAFNPNLANPFHFTPQNNFPIDSIEHCGAFNLYYDDYLHVPAAGFADPLTGAERRSTLCAVLTEIESKINIPVGVTIDIFIDRSFSTSNQYNGTGSFLAFAGPSYPSNFTTNSGIYNGALFNHIVQGVDPDTANYDMSVTVNFDRYYNSSSSSYVNIDYYDDFLNPVGTCKTDLFTVMLHEITHGLGFLSLVSEDSNNHDAINGNSGNVYNNAFSRYDQLFLFKGDILTGNFNKLVNANDPLNPFINPIINTSIDPLRSNDIWLYNNGVPLNHPVYSGNYYVQNNYGNLAYTLAPNSFISHLDLDLTSFAGMSQYSPGFRDRYVMGSSIDKNEFRRFWTNGELRLLVALGYSLNPVFAMSPEGQIISNNSPAYRTNPAVKVTDAANFIISTEVPTFDFTIINNNSPANQNASSLVINITGLPNIADLENDPISVMPNSLFGIRGVSSGGNNHNLLNLNAAGTQIIFTPSVGYDGIAQFGFFLWDGKERGAFKMISINVLDGAYVPPIGNELIINGGFEDGTEVRLKNDLGQPYTCYDSGLQGEYYEGTIFSGAQPYSYHNNGWGPYGAGIVVKDSYNTCSTSSSPWLPNFGAASNSSASLTSGGNFHVPVHFSPSDNERYNIHIYGGNSSPLYLTLIDSLRPNKYYVAEFDISFPQVYYSPVTVGTQYSYSFSSISNPIGNPWSQTVYCTATSTDTIRAVSNGQDTSGFWHHIVDTFQYCSSTPSKFLKFIGANQSHVSYDNFSIKQIPSRVRDTVFASATIDGVNYLKDSIYVCFNDTVLLNAVMDTTFLCNIKYTWFPSNDTTQTKTVIVNSLAPVNYIVNAILDDSIWVDTIRVIPVANPIVTITPNSSNFCQITPITLTANGANTYLWNPATGLSNNSNAVVQASPLITTTYTVIGTNIHGCSNTATTTVTVGSTPIVLITPSAPSICTGQSVTLTASGANTYFWNTFNTTSSITVSPTVTTNYFVNGSINGCSATANVTITVDQNCCFSNRGTNIGAGGAVSTFFPTGSISTNNVNMNGDFIVTSNFTFNNVGNFQIAPNKKIIINSGHTLTINNCNLYTCSNQMWEGIEIQAGGTLILTNSRIEDAMIAVRSVNQTGVSNFTIDNTNFNRNYTAIQIENHSTGTPHPGSITNCTFDSQAWAAHPQQNTQFLDAPYTSQTAENGIYIFGVDGFQIGNPSTAAMQNKFRYLRTGIKANKSVFTVYNNDFKNNFPTSPTNTNIGWAIYATSCPAIIIGGYNVNETNNFKDLSNGIYSEKGSNMAVLKNTFTNILAPTSFLNLISTCIEDNLNNGGTITIADNDIKNTRTAIWHQFSQKTKYTAKNNLLKNANLNGMYCLQNNGGTITIDANDFNQSVNSIYTGNIGIQISNAAMSLSASPLVTITNNTIFRINKGIYLTLINRPQVNSNTIGFANNINPSIQDYYYGIRAMNGDLETVKNNTIYKNGGNPTIPYETSLYGISIESNSSTATIKENSTQKLGTGLRFRSYNNANTRVTCNIMTNDWAGLTLDAVNIGAQGSAATPPTDPFGVAQDNQWSAIPNSMAGAVSVRGLASYTFSNFYSRSNIIPWCPPANKVLPIGAIYTANNAPALLGGIVSNAPQNCSNICYNPATCRQADLVKIARNQNPFNNVTGADKTILQQGLLQAILADSSIIINTSPDADTLLFYKDTTIANTEIGKIAMVAEFLKTNDLQLAQAKNDQIDPKTCIEEYHKRVNDIYLETWAREIFVFTPLQSEVLTLIANQDPLICGRAVYDARVMMSIDVNDFSLQSSGARLANISDSNEIDGTLYPNPTTSEAWYETNLEDDQTGIIAIYDLNGKLLQSKILEAGSNKIKFDLSELSAGVYYYKVSINGELLKTNKIILQK